MFLSLEIKFIASYIRYWRDTSDKSDKLRLAQI